MRVVEEVYGATSELILAGGRGDLLGAFPKRH